MSTPAQVWSYRTLIANLAQRELKSKYKRSFLGWTWSLINPAATLAIYTVVFGYFLKLYGFPVAPVILGMILGPLMDRSYRQAMLSAQEDVLTFASEFFTSPLSATLLAALLFTVLSQTRTWKPLRGRGRRGGPAQPEPRP